MSARTVLSVDRLSKRYSRGLHSGLRYGVRSLADEALFRRVPERPALRSQEFWALDDVSFQLEAGEALGVIGSNGAGKTTLLRVLHGLTKPDFGEVSVHGSTAALIEIGTSFDASLTGRESIELEAAVLGLSSRLDDAAVERITKFSEVGEFIDAPLRTYSTGMRLRLGYSVAAELNPTILLIDEVLAVGDIGFQRKCLGFIRDYLSAGGSLVLVSHDMWMVKSTCSRCLVLGRGSVIDEGTPDETITRYLSHRAPERLMTGAEPLSTREGPVSVDDPDEAVDEGEEPDDRAAAVPLEVVRVNSVDLVRPDGSPPSPRAPAVLDISVDAGHVVESVEWEFTISEPSALSVVVSGRCGGTPPMSLDVGASVLRVTVDSLPLVAGTYEIRVAVIDAQTGYVIGHRGIFDPADRVSVEEPPGERTVQERMIAVMGISDVDTWSHAAGRLLTGD